MWMLALLLVGCLPSGYAATAGEERQFSVVQWKHRDGLPSTAIDALAQTSDGFLWLGTADGLVRYDGFEFVRESMASHGLGPLGEVTALQPVGSGALLAGTAAGVLLRLEGRRVVTATISGSIGALELLPGGFVRVTTANAQQDFFTSSLKPAAPAVLIAKIPDKSHVAIQVSSPDCLKLQPKLVQVASLVGAYTSIRKVLCGRNGAAWVGTGEDGVFLFNGDAPVQHFSRFGGLSSDRVRDLLEDREGNIWVATEDGLNRLRPDKFVTLARRDGLQSDTPAVLAEGVNGSLWIGSASGLQGLSGGRSWLLLPKVEIKALSENEDGSLFALANKGLYLATAAEAKKLAVGVDAGSSDLIAVSHECVWLYSATDGLRLYREGEPPERIPLPSTAASVTSMAAVPERELWLGLADGSVLHLGSSGIQTFTVKDGLPGAAITYLATQPDGSVWIATSNGLVRYSGGRMRRWSSSSGLPGDRLLWAVPDRLGNLWIGYTFGVAEVSIVDLLATYPATGTSLKYRLFDDGDGLQGIPTTRSPGPVALTSDGKLWLTMTEGVAMIDPAHILQNTLAPPTRILHVTADGAEVPIEHEMELKPHNRTLEIRYAGLSFAEPRKVHYRYWLEGFDPGWRDAGPRHTAFYTNLGPGSYRFHVVSSNNDGIWDDSGATLAFQIAPTLYQTNWFRALIVCAVLLTVAGFYQLRFRRNARALKQEYEVRMRERGLIAQHLHDNLIQELMGVGLHVEMADAETPGEARAKAPLTRALQLVQRAIGQGRLTLQQLRQEPLSFAELKRTLHDTATLSGSAAALRFECTGTERLLQAGPAEEVVQILREAVRNAVQHAQPGVISIQAIYGVDRFTLVIRDQGPGIPAEVLAHGIPGHYGLVGMQERAKRLGATLELQTSSGAGTVWCLSLPATFAYQPASDSEQGRRMGRRIQKRV